MPNPVWPATLPNPEYGLTEGEVDSMIIRSGTDSGVAKQRLRFTAIAVPVTGQWTFTRAQYLVFKNFVENTLKYVKSFDWHDMMADSAGVVTYRFTKKPSYTREGYDQVRVNFSLERMP